LAAEIGIAEIVGEDEDDVRFAGGLRYISSVECGQRQTYA
jgi:hypothetical protein